MRLVSFKYSSETTSYFTRKEFERIGGTQTIKTNARVVTATNRNLQEMVDNKEFREDLYYRLNVFPIKLPPLRERGKDIEKLSLFFS